MLPVPRNMQIFITQYIAAGFLLYGFIILIPFIKVTLSGRPYDASGLAVLSVFSALPIIIGLSIFYFSQQYVQHVFVEKKSNVLYVIKDSDSEEIDLSGIVSLISKTIKQQIGGVKHYLIIKFNDHELELFKECAPVGYRWELLADNLGNLIGVPVLKEYWVENYNGKLLQRSRKDHLASYKKRLLTIIPAVLALLAAVGYVLSPTRTSFLSFGLLSVLVNVVLSLLFITKNKKDVPDWAEKKYLLVVYGFFSLIQYAVFYLVYAFLFSGFKLPGIL
jgi:hypothetical protein